MASSALSFGLASLALALAGPATPNVEQAKLQAQVDHILLGASDLDRAVTEFERLTGVRPLYGGKHPIGTHNALVSLGNGLYLELIALQPGVTPPPVFSQLAALENLTPIGWAASTPATQQTRQRLESEGFQISDVRAGSRIKPDGTTLHWQTFELQQKLPGAPFFISWAAESAHPSATSPTGCKLESFTIATPESEVLNRLLSVVEISLPVQKAQAERFTVALDCPKGKVVFKNNSSSSPGKGYILGPEEGEKVLSHLMKVDPEMGSQRLALGRQRLSAGRGIALHIHDAEDEVLYVASGRGIGVVGEVQREVAPGSLIYVPQGAWHGIRCLEEMDIIWIVSPPNFARQLRELQAAGGDSAPESKRAEIARKHQQRDGGAFLRAVLAGSKWRGQDPWRRVVFDMTGLEATFEDSAGASGTLQLRDNTADGLGFVGVWHRKASETGDFAVYYDFKSGSEIVLKWGEGLQRQSLLLREP